MALSKTYLFLRRLGLKFSEREYGQISLRQAFVRFYIRMRNAFLLRYCLHSVLLSPLNYRLIRPILWRWMGCKVGKDVFIGYEVLLDTAYTHLIEIEDGVHITNRCMLLCHQRDLKNYRIGDDSGKLPYRKGKIHLKKGCLIGVNTVIMPGVTVGEGAVIGSSSLVVKDIPDWTVAVGQPAKVVKHISPRETSNP